MAKQNEKSRLFVDFSGGVNNFVSDFLILDNQSVIMQNLVNDGNKIRVIDWYWFYENYREFVQNTPLTYEVEEEVDWELQLVKKKKNIDTKWLEIQWVAFDGKYLAVILWRHLIIRNTLNEDEQDVIIENAVWLWVDWVSVSNRETYHMTIWNDYVIITNSLMDETTNLFGMWEPPRIYWYNHKITEQYDIKSVYTGFAPRWSLVINDSIYFAGWPQWFGKFGLYKWPTYKRNWENIEDSQMIQDMIKFDEPTGTYSLYVWNSTDITAIIHNMGGIFIWKEDWIYQVDENLNQESKDYLPTTKKITQSGIVSQNAWISVNNQVFYYDWVSVRILSMEVNAWLKDESISKNIQKLLDCLPRNQDKSFFTFEYPFVKLFLSTNWVYNDVAAVYNVSTQSWSWQKWVYATHWVSWYVHKNQRMTSYLAYMDWILCEDNIWTSFLDDPIEFEWLSKWFIYSEDPFQSFELSEPRLYWTHKWRVQIETSVISEFLDRDYNIIHKQSDIEKICIEKNKKQTTGNNDISLSKVYPIINVWCQSNQKYVIAPCKNSLSGHKHYIHIKWVTDSHFDIEQMSFKIKQDSISKKTVVWARSWSEFWN